MLILALGGVLVGFGFLVVSLVTESSTWAWGCVAACVAAGGVLLVDSRGRRAARAAATPVVGSSEPTPVVESGVVESGVVEPVEVDDEPEVLVVDEHPDFHVATCPWLVGREPMSLPAREAVKLGFSPCARCAPARTPGGLTPA